MVGTKVQRSTLVGAFLLAGAFGAGAVVLTAGGDGDGERVAVVSHEDETTTTSAPSTTVVTTTTEAPTTTTTAPPPVAPAAPVTTAAPATTTTVAVVTIPDVVGLTEQGARTVLERQGFTVAVTYTPSSDGRRLVSAQSPTGSGPEGTTVTITVTE